MAWESSGQDGIGDGVYGQRFAADGAALQIVSSLRVVGDASDQTVVGSADSDKLDGGTGTDTASFASETAAVFAHLGWGYAAGLAFVGAGAADIGQDSLVSIEALAGGAGNDILIAGDAAATLDGGAGGDWAEGGPGGDTINGGDDNDAVLGGGGNDTLSGGAGDDGVIGGAGNDGLFGGAGANVYNGGAGADWLQGWGGADQLTGGTGGDSFVYTTNEDSLTTAMDRILDFNRAEGDVIRLVDVDANWLVDGDQAFTIVGAFSNQAGQMTAAYNAGTNLTLLAFDMNGDSLADMAIEVVGNVTSADSFIL